MYYPTRGTSAYMPDVLTPKESAKRPVQKKTAKKAKAKVVKLNTVLVIAAIFVLTLTYLGRYVHIYGQHDEIAKKTAALETIRMENDQLSVEIKSLTDSSRIEQYAYENLNLKKMDSNQIVYLDQTTEDNMQRITNREGNNIFSGIFGLFSGVVEYLR